jgi:L-ribulokinase
MRLAWLWKDHTGWAEAAEITKLAAEIRPQYLAKIGGTYSSEWFYSKILHCLRVAPEVFDAAYSWIELEDFVPAALSGTLAPGKFIAGICAAGHKAMYNATWGGYPDKEFLAKLDPKLAGLRDHLTPRVKDVSSAVGGLSGEWAKKTGLTENIPIAVGAFDCHLGAIGAGVKPGVLVKIIGTSTCDITVKKNTDTLADVPGVCGIVDGSVLPGYFGLEAGQSAVGDIFNWFVEYVQPAGLGHVELTEQAAKLKPGESGLVALDWNNGNRTIWSTSASPVCSSARRFIRPRRKSTAPWSKRPPSGHSRSSTGSKNTASRSTR